MELGRSLERNSPGKPVLVKYANAMNMRVVLIQALSEIGGKALICRTQPSLRERHDVISGRNCLNLFERNWPWRFPSFNRDALNDVVPLLAYRTHPHNRIH